MNEEKAMSITIIVWIGVIFLVMLLAGCAKQSPVSEINNGIQEDVAQLVDYAQNNMTIDTEKQLLINGARACASRANDMYKTCAAEIKACEKETTAWKMSTLTAIAFALFFLVMWFRK